MTDEHEKDTLESRLSDMAGWLAPLLAPLLFVALFVLLSIFGLQQKAEEFSKESVVAKELYGKVAKVETWELDEDPVLEQHGNMKVRLSVRDKTRITFEDGRSKEFFGMPKNPVPRDVRVVVLYNRYNVLLDVADAAEYEKKQQGEPQ